MGRRGKNKTGKKCALPVSAGVDIGEACVTSEQICQVVIGSATLGFRGVSRLDMYVGDENLQRTFTAQGRVGLS